MKWLDVDEGLALLCEVGQILDSAHILQSTKIPLVELHICRLSQVFYRLQRFIDLRHFFLLLNQRGKHGRTMGGYRYTEKEGGISKDLNFSHITLGHF